MGGSGEQHRLIGLTRGNLGRPVRSCFGPCAYPRGKVGKNRQAMYRTGQEDKMNDLDHIVGGKHMEDDGGTFDCEGRVQQ
jgi:hypothetical protein